jgi:site-specific recombinase XerD
MAGRTTLVSEDCSSSGFDSEIQSYIGWLRSAGYSQSGVWTMQRDVTAFAQWLRSKQVSIVEADESRVDAFLSRVSHRSKSRRAGEGVALRRFLEHLRSQDAVATRPPTSKPSPDAEIERRYVAYLRGERGLAETDEP